MKKDVKLSNSAVTIGLNGASYERMKEILEEIALKKILDGNMSACRYIVDKYKDYVYNIAFRICKNNEEAEEAAQDSFMKAFGALKDFNFKSKFSTWLYRIAFNTAISRTRAAKFFTNMADYPFEDSRFAVGDLGNGIEQMAADEKRKLVRDALAALPGEDALLINLYYDYDHNFNEIASITGLTVENVKVRMHRIRKKILHHLSLKLKNEINDLI